MNETMNGMEILSLELWLHEWDFEIRNRKLAKQTSSIRARPALSAFHWISPHVIHQRTHTPIRVHTLARLRTGTPRHCLLLLIYAVL